MWIFCCLDKSWPFQLQKLHFGTKSAFSGEFLVVEEEKTYCSDQEALCIETLQWNKQFEKQNASDIYFKCNWWLPIAQLIDAVYKRSQRWYLSSAPENVRQLGSELFIFSEGLNGWAMIRICKTDHSRHQLQKMNSTLSHHIPDISLHRLHRRWSTFFQPAYLFPQRTRKVLF